MRRAMATEPAEKMASTAATTRNAAPMATRPVTAYRVVTTPATTVSGATALRMKKTTAGTPRRSLARAADTLPRELGEDMVVNISVSPSGEGSPGVFRGVRRILLQG